MGYWIVFVKFGLFGLGGMLAGSELAKRYNFSQFLGGFIGLIVGWLIGYYLVSFLLGTL